MKCTIRVPSVSAESLVCDAEANAVQPNQSKQTPKSEKLLLRFRTSDSRLGVTRATVKRLAEELGLNETQVIHYALKQLATELLPAYEADDGALTTRELRAIQSAAGGRRGKSVRSSLFEDR